jgi:hypothetical protein
MIFHPIKGAYSSIAIKCFDILDVFVSQFEIGTVQILDDTFFGDWFGNDNYTSLRLNRTKRDKLVNINNPPWISYFDDIDTWKRKMIWTGERLYFRANSFSLGSSNMTGSSGLAQSLSGDPSGL